MRLPTLFMIGLATLAVGCAEREQAPPEEPVAMEEEAPAAEPEAVAEEAGGWRNQAFLDHMHAHAEQLDELNFALDDGDLEAATTPAFWLSRHKTVDGLAEDLRPYAIRMREAARAVEYAEDIETARAAAARISDACSGCHEAVGAKVR